MLVWPAAASGDGDHLFVSLDEERCPEWLHIYGSDGLFVFSKVETYWDWQRGVTLDCQGKEPLVKHNLLKPSSFTFNDLAILAGHFGFDKPWNATRANLLEFLAHRVSNGDAEYITSVLSADNKKNHCKKEEEDDATEESNQLLEEILDNMDDTEKKNFDELHSKIKNKKNVGKAAHWKKLYDEKCQEEEVAWLLRNFKTNCQW